MSESITGVHKGPLTVHGDVHLSGIAEGPVVVRAGGSFHASGIVSNGLRVEDGGNADVSGILNGSVHVADNGRLHISGIVNGSLSGPAILAVGCVVKGRQLAKDGTWVNPSQSGDAVAIDAQTKRYQLKPNGGLSEIN
jgi:hypothetical protein